MKIAILHEMLVKLWGAEKVIEKILSIFPDADLYTLIYDEKKVWDVFPRNYGKWKIIQSAGMPQFIYDLTGKQRLCLPFMAKAVESLDFSKYDLVIISSSGFAHGAITKPETKTIVYYHSPSRYLWDWTNEYKRDIGWSKWIKWRILGNLFLRLREWDFLASQRNDILLANSKNVATRVQKYYKKTAAVLYPPVEVSRFSAQIPEETFSFLEKTYKIRSKEYYIVLGALTEFKKVEIAIEAFQKMPEKQLVIIGEWPLKAKLQKMCQTSNNIHIIGAQYGANLVALVQNALWLVFPGEEDFWIVPIEAMWAGIPVFAYKAWGLLESVIEGKTGAFFEHPEGKDFVRLFETFDTQAKNGYFSKDTLISQAQKFSEEVFEEGLQKICEA